MDLQALQEQSVAQSPGSCFHKTLKPNPPLPTYPSGSCSHKTLKPNPLLPPPPVAYTPDPCSHKTPGSCSPKTLTPNPVLCDLLCRQNPRFLLTQNPDAEAKVLQELRDAGVPCDGDSSAAAALLSLELLKQLPYCTAVLQEAMRLFPAGVMAASR
jgi:hypothetical protein